MLLHYNCLNRLIEFECHGDLQFAPGHAMPSSVLVLLEKCWVTKRFIFCMLFGGNGFCLPSRIMMPGTIAVFFFTQ